MSAALSRLTAVTASAAVLGAPALAGPIQALPASLPDTAPPLLLALFINGEDRDQLIEVEQVSGSCDRAEAGPLIEAGLYAGAGTAICLQALAGVAVDIDPVSARLDLYSDRLPARRHTPKPHPAAFARPITGLTADYGLSLQHFDTGDAMSLSAFGDLAAKLHTPHGRLQNDLVFISADDRTRVERFRTVYQYDFIDSLTQLSIGDSFTRAPVWGRVSSFAGLQVGTDLSMDPDQSYLPFHTLKTLLRERSDVDIRVNGIVRERTSIDPGLSAFDLRPEAGLNEIEVTIRDANGLTRVEDYSFFSSPRALAAGVTDYSVSVGVPRRLNSARAAYEDEVLANAFLRRGLTDTITSEAFLEMGPGSVMGGGGAQFIAGPLGTIDLSGALSHSSDNRSGQMLSARLDRTTAKTSFDLQARLASDDFTDSLTARGVAFPDVSIRASIGQFTDAGTFRATYTEESDAQLTDRRFASVSWTRAFARNRYSAFASAYHDIEREESGLSLGLRATFGDYSARTAATRTLSHDLLSLQVSRAHQGEFGTQWSMQASQGDSVETVQASLITSTAPMDVFLNAGRFGDAAQLSAGIRGGVVLTGSDARFARQTGTSAALVRTGSLAGTPIYQSNRKVGTTGDDGSALVANLRAFETNTLTINPDELPLDQVARLYRADFIPRRGLVEVAFKIEQRQALAFTVYTPDGNPLETGSLVRLTGSQDACLVGFDGRVYCDSADDDDMVEIDWQGQIWTRRVGPLRRAGEIHLLHNPGVEMAGVRP